MIPAIQIVFHRVSPSGVPLSENVCKAALTVRLADLTGQVEGLVGLLREQGLRITTLAERQAEQQAQIREQQTQIRQILHRLEQHDARFEEQNGHIRRILDLLQHRGGDGASGSH